MAIDNAAQATSAISEYLALTQYPTADKTVSALSALGE
jgi:hypothetical protein